MLSIDLSFLLETSLLHRSAMDAVERLLREQLPEWSVNMTIVRSPRDKRPVKDFAVDVMRAALERGEAYTQMASRYGRGEFDRKFGSVEIRGATRDFIAVMQLDERIFAPIASTWFWGNSLTLQFRSARRLRPALVESLRVLALSGCRTLSPAYAHGSEWAEYAKKNMDYSSGASAIGLDVSRYLPGVYWFNFFGRRYCDLIGKDRLLRSPAQAATALDEGVAVFLAESPSEWTTTRYKDTEREVLKHCGPHFFFDRDDPTRTTMAPDYGLPALPRRLRGT